MENIICQRIVAIVRVLATSARIATRDRVSRARAGPGRPGMVVRVDVFPPGHALPLAEPALVATGDEVEHPGGEKKPSPSSRPSSGLSNQPCRAANQAESDCGASTGKRNSGMFLRAMPATLVGTRLSNALFDPIGIAVIESVTW